jgi:Rod binding domain-containing protein
MNITSSPISAVNSLATPQTSVKPQDMELRETFRQFVGETVFGQMMSSMRSTVKQTPLMHGGRGEEVFQKQLDQELAKQLATKSADRFADPMFDLFMLQRAQ